MTLRLRTFGAVCLERDGAPLVGAPAQKRRLALLAYLALAGDAPVTRDKLMALLWPERDAARGRHSLSQLLYALRLQLPADALIAGADAVRLDAMLLPSDAREFCDAVRAGADEHAVELYRGPFLDGFFVGDAPEFDEWAELQRARCRALYAEALDRLAEKAAAAADTFRVLDWRRRRVLLDPDDARATIRLMQALKAVGDLPGALRQARSYERFMRETLGDAPDLDVLAEAQRLHDELSAGAAFVEPENGPTRIVTSAVTPASTATEQRAHGARWPVIAGLALAFGLIVIAATQKQRSEGAELPRAAVSVLIGHLDGADVELALAVREALRAELATEPTVSQISDRTAHETLKLMGHAPLARLRPPELVEVGMRSGAHIVIAGSAGPLGTGTQLRIDLIDAASGKVIRTLSERAADVTGVLPAVANIGRQLRAAILAVPLDTTIRALPAVKTWSLPALKSYALARRAAAQGWRDSAIYHAERAVTHDSTFALAHYLAGDLLWFLDRQSHAEAHLTRANALSEELPLRERLLVRARYQQLVEDRPDSALAYWDLLRDASPKDAIAYEGRSWTLRALGRYEEAVLAADSALQLEPAAALPNASNALFSLLSVGDTAGALAFAARVGDRWPGAMSEARFHAAVVRHDFGSALRVANSITQPDQRNALLLEAYVAAHDLPRARAQLKLIRQSSEVAHFPRALIAQGGLLLCMEGDREGAAAHAREALEWVSAQDLSAPALGRLAERIGDLAARAGDQATVDAAIELVRARDAGRALPSYVLTQRTLAATRAFVQGDMTEAARLAEIARYGVYFSRSLNTIVALEADARRASGQAQAADSLDHLVRAHQIADGDFWSWIIVRALLSCPAAD